MSTTPNALARLEVQPVEATPGLPISTDIVVTNLADTPTSFSLSVSGLEPEWVQVAETIGPIEPGSSASMPLQVLVPVGYPPCTMIGAVSVRHIDTGDVLGAADLAVTVGDGSRILASLEPPDVHGWRGGRLTVVLRNRGRQPTKVNLAGVSNDKHFQMKFEDAAPVLPPGKELRVGASACTRAYPTGAARRKPFGVKVQGRSTPLIVEGSLVQRPLIPKKVMKLGIVAVVVALWAAAVTVGISDLSAHLQRSAQAKAVATQPPVAASSAPAGGPVGPNAGSSNGGGSGSGGSGSGSGGSGSSSGAAAGSAANGVRVGGKVAASEPGGVTVTITPTSLTNANTSGATPAGTNSAPTTAQLTADITTAQSPPIGKVYGTAIDSTLNAGLTAAAGQPTLSTTTRPDGTWAIAGLKAPGTYLVTFSKAGFSTRSYLLTTTSSGTTMVLNGAIAPGNGSISGDIRGPDGQLGGVTVTLSDGTVTLSTRTPTTGADIGHWALSGLTTPDNYLVTASKAGYGTVTTTVNLAASGSATGIDLKMRSGVAAITGTVLSDPGATGIGGIKVTATDGSVTEVVTTVTVGTVGSYSLPNLPIPGTYALTVTGSGWVTQTQKVDLKANTTIGASLIPTGADVIGTALSSSGNGIGAAGVTMTDGSNTYKTLTQSTAPVGSFDFGQVPAGNYVLTISEYGYGSASEQVTVTSGQVSTVSLVLDAATGTSMNTGIIQGTVDDLFNSTGLSGIPVYIDGTLGATSGSTGNYQINNVAPGVHTITAQPSSSLNYSAASVRVNVPLGGTVIAPVIALPRLDTLSGTVTSGAGTGGIVGASVVLSASNGTGTGTSGNTGTVTTTTTPAPSGSSGVSGPSGSTGSTGVSGTGSTTTSASGTYSLTGLQSGNYQVVVSATGYETQTVDVSLGVDENLNENVVLTLAPDFNIVTYASTGSGGLSQAAGVCVTVTGSGYSETELTSATSSITFTPLTAGVSYTATFWQPSGSTGAVTGTPPAAPCPQDQPQIGTAPPYTFTAQLNNSSVYTAVIAPQLPGLSVSLTYQYEIQGTHGGTTVDCPVVTVGSAPPPNEIGGGTYNSCPTLAHVPTITVTGIVGYTPSTNGTLGTPETSSPISATAVPTGTTSDTWTFASSAFSSLVSQQITIAISGTSTPLEGTSETITLSSTNDTPSIVLIPTPVSVTESGLPSGTTVSVTPSSIPTNVNQNGTTTATITETDSGGTLAWGDTLVGAAGLAEPGSYTLSASAPGYEQPTAEIVTPGVSSGVLTGATTTVDLGLNQQTTLTVSVSNWTQFDSLSPPTVYLLYNGQPVSSSNGGAVTVTDTSSSVTTSGASQLLSSGSDSAVYTYLSPNSEVNKGSGLGYEVAVVTPGYQTYFDTLGSLSSASMSVTANLTSEGALSGNVLGVLDPTVAPVTSSNLSGVTVTATPVPGFSSPCSAPANEPSTGYAPTTPGVVTATTNSSGAYVLTGSAGVYTGGSTAATDGGLCPGDQYTVAMTIPGYGSVAVPSNVTVAQDNVAVATQTMNANPFIQGIKVTGPTSGIVISASGGLGENFVCDQGTYSGNCVDPTTVSGLTGATFALLVYPTSYTYSIQAANYQTVFLSAIAYTPNEAAANQPISDTPLTVALQGQENTITGSVMQNGASVNGLSIGLYNALSNTLATGTGLTNPVTSSGGSYTFSDVSGGNYYTEPIGTTGYQDVAVTNFVTSYPFTTINNLSVQPVVPTSTTVTVSTTAQDSNIANAQVSLVQDTSPGTPAPSCANTTGGQPLLLSGEGSTGISQTITSGSAVTFSSVTPDYYQISVALSGTGMPGQAKSAPFAICPTTSPSTAVALTYQVQEGEITGTITLGTATSSAPAVSVTPVAGGTASSPSPDCGTFPSTLCNYASYTVLNDSYTVTASLTGYVVSPASLTVSTPHSGLDTQTNENLSLWFVPTVASVSPSTSLPAGGSQIAVTGSGFVAGQTSVDFGSTAGTSVSVTNSGLLTVDDPAGTGLVDVTVTTPGGTSAISSSDHFFYVPTVSSVSPADGPTAGGNTVTVNGTGFVIGSTTVKFGLTAGTNVSVASSTSLTVKDPAATAGTVDVTVTTSGGTSSTFVGDEFSYDAVPTVSGTSPTDGPTGGGTSVTISGTGFVNGATSVDFGGTTIGTGSVTWNSTTSITVTSPAGTLGSANVSVTTPGGTSGNTTFHYDNAPTVTGTSPTDGPTAGGTSVTISGTDFVSGLTSVDFAGTTIGTGSVTWNSATSITVTSPAGSAGSANVSVTTPGGTSGNTTFNYDGSPTVTGTSPSAGPTAGGTSVTISGTGFVSGQTSVDFGGTTIGTGSVTWNSATSITVTSPSGSTGAVNVSVTTPGGTSGNTTFNYDGSPTVTGTSPSAGPTAGGTSVTISGTGFVSGQTSVDFGGTTIGTGSVTWNSATSVTVTSPSGSAGSANVSVTTPGGTSGNTTFTYDAAPTVSGTSPSVGPAAGGTSVTISGTGFVSGQTSVDFGGTTIGTGSVTWNSATSVTVTSPSGSAGSANVSVTTPGGTSGNTTFTYDAAPTVSGTSPSAGPTAGGTSVTISGTGFVSGQTSVDFGGTTIGTGSVTWNSATSVTVTSPSGSAGSANVSVTTPGGTSGNTTFTYDAAPTVTNLNPSTGGNDAGGDSVVITGTGFVNGLTSVDFGGTTIPAGSVTWTSSTSITVTSPAGTGTVNVSVTTPGGTSGTQTFTYT